MKIKIVPAKELITKTLRAKDYVLKPYKVTWREEIEHVTIVHLDACCNDQAQSMLESMDDSALIRTLMKGEKKEVHYRERYVTGVEGAD